MADTFSANSGITLKTNDKQASDALQSTTHAVDLDHKLKFELGSSTTVEVPANATDGKVTITASANEAYGRVRSIAVNSSENIDLSGVLTDGFGNTIAFTAVKELVIVNLDDFATLTVGAAASNAFSTLFADATDAIKVPPRGSLRITAPKSGFAVTAGTGDILKVASSNDGSGPVKYVIAIVGVK